MPFTVGFALQVGLRAAKHGKEDRLGPGTCFSSLASVYQEGVVSLEQFRFSLGVGVMLRETDVLGACFGGGVPCPQGVPYQDEPLRCLGCDYFKV